MRKYAFEQVVEDYTSQFHKVKKEDYLSEGQYRIVDQSKEFVAGYTNDKRLVNMLHIPIIIFGDHTRIFKYIDFPLVLGADGAKALVVKDNLAYTKYLYYYFRTLQLPDAGYSRHFKFLKRVSIPILENYDDQIRVATILAQVEKLIVKRKESIKLLDELLQNIFWEMFGLKSKDYKQWKVESLSTKAEIVSGVTKGKKYKLNNLREVPYMRVANVQDGYFDLTEIKKIKVTEAEINQYKLIKGDLLLTEGGDPDKLGRGAVWNNEIDECIHQNHIFRVRLIDSSINPIFLGALMSSKYGKNYFLKAAKQTTGIASINSRQLKAFPVFIPPSSLQKQFAAIVKKVEVIKTKYNQNFVELETLYSSLSQRAFKGEIDLSRVPIDVVNKPEITMDEPIDLGNCSSINFSKIELTKIIKTMSARPFHFNELCKKVEQASFEPVPEYEEIKDIIYTMLKEKNPVLKQSFEEVFDASTEERMKKVVLRVNV